MKSPHAGHRHQFPTFRIVERHELLTAANKSRNCERLLDRAFAYQHVITMNVFYDHRHATAHEIERQFVDLLVELWGADTAVLSRELNDGNV